MNTKQIPIPIIHEIKLIDGDIIKYYYVNKLQIILCDIGIDFTNPKMAFHNVNLFCEKLTELDNKVRYIQHYADIDEYENNKELYDKFHIQYILYNNSICLIASIDDFPNAYSKCVGWKE